MNADIRENCTRCGAIGEAAVYAVYILPVRERFGGAQFRTHKFDSVRVRSFRASGCVGGRPGFREVYAVDFVPLAGEACGTLRSCERPFESERGGADIGEDEIACEGRACAL